MDGVIDLLTNGLQESPTHKEMLSKWQIESNSVKSWLHDEDNKLIGCSKDSLPKSKAYALYKGWCLATGCGFSAQR